MKRIICHWSAGKYKASSIDRKHYHFIFESDGKEVAGNNPVSANRRIVRGKPYAAHTRYCNTGSIGLSVACMWNANERDFGDYPMTETQFEAMCAKAADLCREYDIDVTPRTVLSHAEVEGTLGKAQRGKWDFTRLPFKPSLKGAKKCGDYMRERVEAYMTGASMPMGLLHQDDNGEFSDRNYNVTTDPEDLELRHGMAKNSLVEQLQELLNRKSYPCGVADGIFGKETRRSVLGMKADNGLDTSDETITLRQAEACEAREVGEERAGASVAHVVEHSKTAKLASDAMKADAIKVAGGAATVGASLNIDTAKDVVGKAEEGQALLERSQDVVQRLTGGALDVKMALVALGVIVTVLALYGAWKSRGALMRRVEDYTTGRNLGH